MHTAIALGATHARCCASRSVGCRGKLDDRSRRGGQRPRSAGGACAAPAAPAPACSIPTSRMSRDRAAISTITGTARASTSIATPPRARCSGLSNAGERGPGVPDVVEHPQVLDQGRLRIGGERVDLTAGQGGRGRGDRDPPLRVRQRRGVEEAGDALAPLDLHEQHPAAAGRKRDGQCPGYRRLARPALAGDDVQPDTFPVRVPRPHSKQAIVARRPHLPCA